MAAAPLAEPFADELFRAGPLDLQPVAIHQGGVQEDAPQGAEIIQLVDHQLRSGGAAKGTSSEADAVYVQAGIAQFNPFKHKIFPP